MNKVFVSEMDRLTFFAAAAKNTFQAKYTREEWAVWIKMLQNSNLYSSIPICLCINEFADCRAHCLSAKTLIRNIWTKNWNDYFFAIVMLKGFGISDWTRKIELKLALVHFAWFTKALIGSRFPGVEIFWKRPWRSRGTLNLWRIFCAAISTRLLFSVYFP